VKGEGRSKVARKGFSSKLKSWGVEGGRWVVGSPNCRQRGVLKPVG